jgi:hypothetical protein
LYEYAKGEPLANVLQPRYISLIGMIPIKDQHAEKKCINKVGIQNNSNHDSSPEILYTSGATIPCFHSRRPPYVGKNAEEE